MDNLDKYQDIIPDGAIPMVGVRIISYYDDQGQMGYRVANDENGTVPVTSLIGLIELVKANIITKAAEIARKMKEEDE